MRITIAVAGLLAVGAVGAVTLPAAAGDRPPDVGAKPKPGELVFRPEAARKLSFVRRVKFRSEAKVPKKKHVGEGESVTDLELTIGPREAADGSRRIEVRSLGTTGWWSDTDTPRVDFDTSKAPVPPASHAYILVQRASPGSFTVLPDARIVEIDELVAQQTRVLRLPPKDPARTDYLQRWTGVAALAEFAGCWPALPPKRMGAGTFFETESVAPWQTGPFQRLRLRHELKVLDERRAVFATAGGVDDVDPANARGASKKKDGAAAQGGARLKSSGFGASAEVDRADGLVRKSSYRFTIVMAQRFTVDGDDADGTSTTVIESVLERRDGAEGADSADSADGALGPDQPAQPAPETAPGTPPPDPGGK